MILLWCLKLKNFSSNFISKIIKFIRGGCFELDFLRLDMRSGGDLYRDFLIGESVEIGFLGDGLVLLDLVVLCEAVVFIFFKLIRLEKKGPMSSPNLQLCFHQSLESNWIETK